jgi:hypothetical protein
MTSGDDIDGGTVLIGDGWGGNVTNLDGWPGH